MTSQAAARGRSTALNSVEDWMEQRNADLRRLAAGAHAAGHEIWAEANRAGRYLSAPRPSDVATLGVSAMRQSTPQSHGPAGAGGAIGSRPRGGMPPELRAMAQEAGGELLPGLNGAQDAFTFGVGDRAYAGVRAFADAAHGEDLARAYSRHYAGTQALDAYDAAHHPIARAVGQLAGTGAQIALTGGGEGLIAAGARIPQVSDLLAREGAAMGAGGALVGVGGQATSDVLQGKMGTLGDYGGAAVGGATGVLAARLAGGWATYGGATAGATTSVAQDLLNGRAISFDRAREAAGVGGGVGGLTGGVGRAWSNSLSNAEKEQLGEGLSRLRTATRGDWTKPVGKSRAYLDNGRFTYPDQRTYGGELVESKFGLSARLSPRQLDAYRQPLPGYRVDHFIPPDIGVAFGLPSAALSYGLGEPNE